MFWYIYFCLKLMKPRKFIVIDFLVVLKVATRVLPEIVRIKNASVSRFFLTSLKAWFQTLMEFNTLNIYFSIYFFQYVCKVTQVHHHVLILPTETTVKCCVTIAKICVMHPQDVKILPQVCSVYSINKKIIQ